MTRLFGVLGHPITHSLSPVMHTAALRALKLDAVYGAFDAPPRFVAPILHALILSGVEGLNVTVPLKQAVLPLLDRLDPTARAMHAVNTIVVRHGRTTGYNTDGVGFVRGLEELGWKRGPTHAIILGAGGAARAVAWELAHIPGSQVVIANRHPGRASALAAWIRRQHPRSTVQAASLQHLSLAGAEVLVNATTVGMRASDRLLVDPAQLRRSLMVYDLVYTRQTPLVQAARRRGCVAANGLSMLLYQGAESLRLWLHRAPPISAMRTALKKAVASEWQVES